MGNDVESPSAPETGADQERNKPQEGRGSTHDSQGN
jgi:hypothetical protein